MNNNIISTDLDKSIDKEKRAMWIGIVMVVVFALTNGVNTKVNTIFVIASYICVMALPLGFSVATLAGVVIYFGWTYIGINTLFPFIQSWHSYQSYFYILVVAKILVADKEIHQKKFKLPMILLMSYIFIIYVRFSFITAIRAVAMLFIVFWMFCNLVEENQYRDIFMKAFIVLLLTVFVYNAVYGIRENSVLTRYAGVRDANNFALWCNMAIAFLLIFKIFDGNKILLCCFIVGCLFTISISGLVVMLAIFGVYHFFTKGATHAIAFVSIVVVIALLIGPIMAFIENLNIQSLQLYVKRLTEIISQLKVGNYDDATTTRTMLWEIYMDIYDNLDTASRLFGSPYLLSDTMRAENILSSHNSAIDILFSYGFVGLVLIAMNLLNIIFYYIKSKKMPMAVLSIIFIVNAFFRSLSGFMLFFPMFL